MQCFGFSQQIVNTLLSRSILSLVLHFSILFSNCFLGKVQDLIRFQHGSHLPGTAREIDARVLYIKKYPTCQEMLKAEGLERCLAGEKSFSEGMNIYHSFPSYLEGEKKFGVVAIGFSYPIY